MTHSRPERWMLPGSIAASATLAVSLLSPPVLAQSNNLCDQPGEAPDVIVGDIVGTSRYGSMGGITSFSIGTTSCNVGTCRLNWISNTAEHPLIGQNMFRLKNGRFEQIGQSWLKHASAALQGSVCSTSCMPADGSHLGVNCSDPYSAGLNGGQSRLGPKFEVNAFTGVYPYPATDMSDTGDALYKRLQVHNDDLDPGLNAGAQYFAEAQYVTLDDSTAGNGANNASYRPLTVSGVAGSGTYDIALTGTTRRQIAGIQAWKATDPTVTETIISVPGDGRMILAAKATALGGGVYHYEYAVQNLNSDRSAMSFNVPIPAGAIVTNVGFHDVDYHSGEPLDGADWTPSVGASSVSWSTTSFDLNPNANALRWGTLYNFRFDANAAPASSNVVIGLFRPGFVPTVTAGTIGPDLCVPNGVCGAGENCTNCAVDCLHQGGGQGCCGTGGCQAGENPCRCPVDCGPQLASEGSCGNGVDEDCDNLTDCTDPDCCTSLACSASDTDGDHYAASCDCNDANSTVYPSAPQLCDGINNDCADPGWPAVPAAEQDGDADAAIACADCDDANAAVHATPGEVRFLALTHDSGLGTTVLSWSPPLDPGGTLLRYDTLRASSANGFLEGAVCVESNGADTTTLDPQAMLPGATFFYLVRAENDCPSGQGSLGTDSSGLPRSGRNCP